MAPRKTATTSPRKAAAQRPEQERGHEPERQSRSVPVLVPEVHVRHVPVPTQVPAVHVAMPASVRERLPEVTPGRVLWWGGLAALAATELISWPVAGVVAAGVYVAEHRARSAMAEQAQPDRRAGSSHTG